jgi:3-deoxy-manno-octulosonate cytidylyltransferase (CMP-KDO synthetase)|tara:strand:+ start:270 stop:1010 length:741 start_codon:yes stop_codon:yes gene_type:complete
MKTHIIIPARLNSRRLPGKLLKKIKDKTLIEHVCQRAKKIKADNLTVATDDEQIRDIVESIGVNCFYIKKEFTCGTDRCSYVAKVRDYSKDDLVINIQADEYNFSIDGVNKIIEHYKKSDNPYITNEVTTLISKSNLSTKNLFDYDTVKVVFDKNNYATAFSRNNIPHFTERLMNYPFHSHIGIYAYKVGVLYDYEHYEESPYEKFESLEQLRFIWNDIKIKCIEIEDESISINSLDDLKRARGEV